MAEKNQSNESKVLVVEGRNDLHVIEHIRKKELKAIDFGINDRQNLDGLLDAMAPEIKVPGREVIGFVVDANDSIDERWQAVNRKLKDIGIIAPNKPDKAGTIIGANDDYPKVGIWLMPDNKSGGELEDFVQQMIDSDDPVWPRAVSYIEGIPSENRKFKKNKEMKAKVYAWLSTVEPPELMGVAISSGNLHCDGLLCKSFVAWIEKLFKN